MVLDQFLNEIGTCGGGSQARSKMPFRILILDKPSGMANVAYQYRVIAKADRLKTESFDPMSEASTPTAPLTPVIPTVTITTPTLSNFAITLDTPEKMVILPTTEKLTVNLASSIDGATAYTWYVNETAIKSGTYANASFVDLTATTAGLLEDAIGGQNNLKLEATINGMIEDFPEQYRIGAKTGTTPPVYYLSRKEQRSARH